MANGVIGDPEVERVVGEILAGDLVDHRRGPQIDPTVLLRRFYKFAAAADVKGRSPEQLAGAAMSLAKLAERRDATEACVRVFNPDPEDDGWACDHTVVHVVVEDMPFLVDSVSGVLNTAARGIQSIIHPIMVVHRDADGWLAELLDVELSQDSLVVGAIDESWLQFEIDKETNVADLAQIGWDVAAVLADVRAAVEDWEKMRLQAQAIAEEVEAVPPPSVTAEECAEAAELLRWLVDDHFTFLGYREYDLITDESGDDSLVSQPSSSLGLLRSENPKSTSFARLSPAVKRKAREPKLLVLTKANRKSTVHRRTYLDYIGIKRFDPEGRVVGERRLIGLFTTSAYSTSVMTIPVLHQIASQVIELSGFLPGSHSEKDLIRFMETYPRDELFQVRAEELWEVARLVLALGERRQTRVFLRADEYGRFVSALVYLPRDKYDTAMREHIGELLMRAYGGSSLDFWPMVSESVLTRLHYVVRLPSGACLAPVDEERIIQEIKDTTVTWDDQLRAALVDHLGEEKGIDLCRRFRGAISGAYREQATAEEAVIDLQRLVELTNWGDTKIELRAIGHDDRFLFALYRLGESVALSNLLPIFGSFGVEVETERSFKLGRQGGIDARIYHVELRLPSLVMARVGSSGHVEAGAVSHLEQRFADAFDMTWQGVCDRDSLNQLVVVAGLSWREVSWVRAWVRYSRQIGSHNSPEYIALALIENPEAVRALADLFRARLDPSLSDAGRPQVSDRVDAKVVEAIDGVENLGYDRILRRLRAIVLATVRTNAFAIDPERGSDALALKIDPARISDMPRPVPTFEVWVWSPRVAGVHLRFGRIARGGLRWSDRPEDFRTEILGLAKAQEIKNAVIVPDGAKGGFVVRERVEPGSSAVPASQGARCYQEFVSALLDVTDNRIRGAVVPPDRTVRWDGDDSYLVVAADKGTASFSDLANDVARRHGFWLGDAFASGGSVGYDHKAMGITARGAWKAVERHFRELGIDVAVDSIRVVGIGDMSGDVFGNAMLLSEPMRLVAAFDHRHVFIDPDPDPVAAIAERRRLVQLPGSSWGDYDPSVVSPGGGVYLRSAKSISVSLEAREVLGIVQVGPMTPDELIRAVLRAPVDLLFNGGVGTFVKATSETNLDVGDKTNDAIRINATELRARVIAEGGNLGLTQA
ncbi:MAG: NAD-glutamate dehydrogenase, partial [Candidatus Nanopelagicales bacterium]|nr:NAD-glutamate dehydrogenase [Candidatus Nanopelagicales bacterium]